ncbi:MAG: hypothetical protein R3F37_09295 [Candidatus Competibacteraceae bacterium]
MFRGDWLDSGDRAYLADGDVYITGRIKEMIVRGGAIFSLTNWKTQLVISTASGAAAWRCLPATIPLQGRNA